MVGLYWFLGGGLRLPEVFAGALADRGRCGGDRRGRARSRWAAVLLTAGSLASCTVQQDFRPSGCPAGRCTDASVGEGGQDTVVLGDAQVNPPGTDDAGPLACPGACLPDDVAACVGFQPSAAAMGAEPMSAQSSSSVWRLTLAADAGQSEQSGRVDSRSSDSGVLADGGLADDADASAGWDAEAGGSADAGAQRRDAGRSILEPAPGTEAGAPPPSAEAVYSCQMVPASPGEQWVSACERAGRGEEGAPCTSPSGCAPGLACVAPGFCRAYCCAGQNACGESTVCDRRPLHYGTQASSSALEVPVCVPVESSCSLGQPWVCEQEPCGNCPSDKTCSVLDKRGSRACVDFGAGRDGQACPCAPGYFCASGSKTCFQYCETTPGGVTCNAGYSCQPGPAAFPSGWGLCVRDTAP